MLENEILQKLESMGIVLPIPPTAAANYVPCVKTGNLLFVSGQLPMKEGKMAFVGQVTTVVSMEKALLASRLCAVNILAQISAMGYLGKIKRFVRIGGFVNAPSGFADHPKIMNGASDFFVSVFGESGRHARTALGVASLPFDAPVEIEALLEIDG
jgi:enamine deaminase RidA (YjgF/YER057c/UK114 family)